MGGWSDKAKSILISTLVEVVVEVEVELDNKKFLYQKFFGPNIFWNQIFFFDFKIQLFYWP